MDLLTFLGTVLVMLFGFVTYERVRDSFKTLKAENEALKNENAKLKDASRRNLPYNTAEELENLLASVVVLKHDLEVRTMLVENIEAHAKLARENRRAGASVNA